MLLTAFFRRHNGLGGDLTKTLWVMHLIVILLLGFCLQVTAKGFSQTITFSGREASLEKIFTTIEKQTGYLMVYSAKKLRQAKPVTISARDMPLEDFLTKALEGQALEFVKEKETIFIRTKHLPPARGITGLFSSAAFPPFTGVITNSDGEPLSGASVRIRGGNIGVHSDAEGRFSINAEPGQTLVISHAGYLEKEIRLGDKTTLDITLEIDMKELSDVVVIGYGSVKKSDLTGAISTVSAKDFERVPATDPLQALQGRAAGLSITSTSGQPGAPSNVLIRGVQTINGSTSPIYVVDGLIMDNINSVNPQDIESVSVLKDASATAIYGARASNGVVLITTKRGSKRNADPEITFHHFTGIQQLSNMKLEVLNAQQYLELYTEAYENNGVSVPWAGVDLSYYNGVDEDWLGRVLQTGALQSYNLSVGGGSKRSNYYVSAGYVNHKGMVIGSDYQKMTIRFNSDYKISNWMTFENSIQLTSTDANGNAGGNTINTTGLTIGNTDIFFRAAAKPPITRAYEANGDYGKIYASSLEHISQSPIWQAKESQTNLKNKGAFGTLGLKIKILDGLEFYPRLNYEFNMAYQTTFIPAVNPAYGWEGATVNSIEKYQSQNLHWIADALLNYQKTFGKHNVSALAGYSWEENYFENLSGRRIGTPNNSIRFLSAGDPVNSLSNANDATDWAFISLFGRVNYSFNDRYLITASIRQDGSSRLGAGNRYGVFPSGSIAWRISREAFMQNAEFISDLKIRASIGKVGNVQSLGVYATVPSLSTRNYAFNNAPVQGFTLASAVNSNLKWETTTKKNIGLDASFYRDRLYGSVDYFLENTFDLLFRKPIPSSTGLAGSPFINAGQVRNTGIEVMIGYRNAPVSNWSYDLNLNFSHVKNRVVDLAGQNLRTSGLVEGYPVASFFGYKANGLIYSAADLAKQDYSQGTFIGKGIGDIWILDIDGAPNAEGHYMGIPDGKVDGNDRTIIGSKYPDFIYGFMGTVSYKNWTLQLQLQGVQGIDRSIYGNSLTFFSGLPHNQNAMLLDRYHPTKNPNGTMPILSYSDKGKNYNTGLVLTDWSLRDASYLRVKNININYALPRNILNKYSIGGISVYMSIQNLYTFTKFPGTEVDTEVDALTGLPQPRTWTFGIKASF